MIAGNCTFSGPSGGIYCSSSNAVIVNNTIVGNQMPSSTGGIFLALDSTCHATVANNLVAFNTGGIIGYPESAITLSHNCVYGNAGLDYGFTSILPPGEGDISVDPKLASLACGDYHIQPDSPCIGAGDNSVVQPDWKDMDGQDRILPAGGTVDIGADESNGETWTPVISDIIRVTPTGDDANDGSAWDDAHAKRTVQAAINSAPAYGEVWVKAGVYNERITLRSLVNTYGGFAGVETDLTQRDPKANVTVLDGQKAGSVVTAQFVAQGTTLDGFTIQNGKVSTNGGGIWCSNASPTIRNNVISGCTAPGNGGGMYLELSSAPVIEGNLITGNTAASGGGIYSYGTWPVIRSNTISANAGWQLSPSNIPCKGAGIYLYMPWRGTVSVTGNTISGNQPGPANGGGVYVYQRKQDSSGLIFDTNTVTDNWSTPNWSGSPTGEGIYGGCRTMVVTNNIFAGNGIGVNLSGGDLTMSGNRIFGSLSTMSPAVTLACSGSFRNNLIAGNPIHALSYSGAGVLDVVNNTIINNGGTGISCASTAAGCKLENNIVAFNGAGISKATSSNPVIANNCVYQNNGKDYQNGAAPGPGDISVDPVFASLQYANIHLQPGSPCIDAGDSSVVGGDWTDLDGQSRIQGGGVDIGADEADGISRPDMPNTIVRVSPSGNDANDGSTWTLAKKTVQAGLDAAGAVGGEVWVRAGTYNERVTVGACTGLFGGFDGTEIEKSQRNWALNKTVLDGQRKDCVVKMAGAVYTTVDGFTIQNGFSDLRGAGVYMSGKNAVLSHNTITRNAPGSDAATVSYDYSSTTIAANNIVGNGGYAIRQHSSTLCTPTITGNTVVGNGFGVVCSNGGTLTSNLIAFNGSGVSANSSTPPSMSHNCVYGNMTNYSTTPDQTGTSGNISVDPKLADYTYGNVHLQPDSPCIDAGGSVASGWTDMDGQAVQGSAVDIGADESDGTSWPQGPNVVLRVTPTGDDANDGSGWDDAHAKKTIQAALDAASLVGGDVWVKAGTYFGNTSLRPFAHLFGGFTGTETDRSQRDWVSNATTLDGQAHGTVVGGGQGHRVSTIDGFTIANGTGSVADIRYPYIGQFGGGIACYVGGPVIRNNRITGNNVEQGAAIGCVLASPLIVNNLIEGNNGSAIFHHGSQPDVLYNTIVGNTGGVLAASEWVGEIRNPRCIGNIAAFNKYGIAGYPPTTRNNCSFGNAQGDDWMNQYPELHNINADPLFVDAANGDYRLMWNSPCVDAGLNEYSPDADYLGVFRPIDGNVDLSPVADMGAFEFAPYQVAFSVLAADGVGQIRIQPNRMLTCAILNDGVFPLNRIDISTVTAGPSKAKEAHGRAHWEDANADGAMDMVLHFKCGDTGIKPGDTQIAIRGRLTTGEPFVGIYSIAVTGTAKK